MKKSTFETPVELLPNIRLALPNIRQKPHIIQNLPNLIVSDVAFLMQIIRELYSAHEKCDV